MRVGKYKRSPLRRNLKISSILDTSSRLMNIIHCRHIERSLAITYYCYYSVWKRIKMIALKLCLCLVFWSSICTCIRALRCPDLNELLRTSSVDQNARDFLKQHRCRTPADAEIPVCCPFAAPKGNPARVVKKKRHANYPWSLHNHGNFFNHNHNGFGRGRDPQQNNQFLKGWNNRWFTNNDLKKDNQDGLAEESPVGAAERCTTPDNFEGICKEIGQCSTMLEVLRTVNVSNPTEVSYLKKFQCPNTGSPGIKVCCSDNPIGFPNNDIVPITSKVDNQRIDRSLIPDSGSCGRESINDKIIGGTSTGLAEYPWTALLQYTTPKGRQYGCGGTVISKRYVVTAAHCVNRDILRKAGLEKLDRIILGEYDTRNDTDCIYTRYGSDCAAPTQIFNVERAIEHELFNSSTTVHDIALIRVDRDITFSNYVMPICLPEHSSFSLSGNESFFITGWGKTDDGKTSPVKRKAKLPFVDKEKCSQLGPLGEGQMCLGSGKGIDSCKGDSGGPVMYSVPLSGDLVTTLVGIVSYGFGRCGVTTSVSTYVPVYIDWILTHLS